VPPWGGICPAHAVVTERCYPSAAPPKPGVRTGSESLRFGQSKERCRFEHLSEKAESTAGTHLDPGAPLFAPNRWMWTSWCDARSASHQAPILTDALDGALRLFVWCSLIRGSGRLSFGGRHGRVNYSLRERDLDASLTEAAVDSSGDEVTG